MEYLKDLIKLKPSTWVVALTFAAAIISASMLVFLFDRELFLSLDLVRLLFISVAVASPAIVIFGGVLIAVTIIDHYYEGNDDLPAIEDGTVSTYVFVGSSFTILFLGGLNVLYLMHPNKLIITLFGVMLLCLYPAIFLTPIFYHYYKVNREMKKVKQEEVALVKEKAA